MAIPEDAVAKLSIPIKTRIALFILNRITDFSCRPDGTVNRRVLHLLDYCGTRVPPNPNPRNGVKTSDVTVDSSRGLWFRLFVPTTNQHSQNLPVIVFFHGGGFVYLTPDFHGYDAVCRRFAREVSAVVVSVNYRLAPEHRYPAQYEDGFDVLEFLDKEKNRILPPNADLSRCFLAGDSAGGNLAHHVAVRACRSEFTHLKVIGVVAIQPFFGGEERTKAETELAEVDLLVSVKRTDWMWKAFLPEGGGMDRDHQVINVSGPNAADISKLDFPATMVVVAGFDSLKDWQKKYYEWLKRSGKEAYLLEYPTMIHAFYIFPELPESKQLVSQARQFILKQCSKLNVE
ncbi:probable carboxylesterase 18 [Primulina huaijiensis]|uniref:probable carboxylesterase 18 n=1 Tax=Primulina huaijiensis TaxID=1492673 RepID=UPI003CC70B59